jgi:hypothetical protein
MYMVNCTLTGNLASADWGSGMAFDSTGHTRPSNVTVVNSILWNGSDQIYNCDGSTISISYSDVQGGYPGTGNIDADPLFVNAAGGDLHLGEGSPCIDAGNDAAIFAFGDFEGHSRPLDGDDDGTFIADIGADEYDGSPTAVTLADLKATQVEGGILVEWMTTMEIDTVGFNVWRNEARDGSYVRINDTLIPSASPGSVWGGAYSHVDSDVIPDTTYYYKLEELEVGGGRNWYGPVSTEDDNPTSVILLRATAGNTDFAALAWWLAGAAIVGGASWVIAGLAKLLQSNNTSVRTRGK